MENKASFSEEQRGIRLAELLQKASDKKKQLVHNLDNTLSVKARKYVDSDVVGSPKKGIIDGTEKTAVTPKKRRRDKEMTKVEVQSSESSLKETAVSPSLVDYPILGESL